MSFWLSKWWTNSVAFSSVDFEISVVKEEAGILVRSSVILWLKRCIAAATLGTSSGIFLLLGDFIVSNGFVNLCNELINVDPKELLCIGLEGELKFTIVMDVLETFKEVFYRLSWQVVRCHLCFCECRRERQWNGNQKPRPWSIFAISFAMLSNCAKPKMLKCVLDGMTPLSSVE